MATRERSVAGHSDSETTDEQAKSQHTHGSWRAPPLDCGCREHRDEQRELECKPHVVAACHGYTPLFVSGLPGSAAVRAPPGERDPAE